MPTEWTTHADGVHTAVSTAHKLDGSLRSVTIQLDTFRVREWEPSEAEASGSGVNIDNLYYDEKEDQYTEHGNGANATLEFTVNDGVAELASITPEDGDRVKPRHMAILPAAERVISHLSDVEACKGTLETMASAYHDAGDVFIEKLDG